MFKLKTKTCYSILLMVAVAIAFVGLAAPVPTVYAETKEFSVFCPGSEAQIERDKKVGSFSEINVPYYVSCKSGVSPTITSPPKAVQGAVAQVINVDCLDRTIIESSPVGRFQCRADAADNSPTLSDATVTITRNMAESRAAATGRNLQASCEDPNLTAANCGIFGYLVKFINILSAVVGIAIVAVITFRGIQYTFSRDNAQETAKAKDGIRDALFALVYYLFITAFLQWVVPGGIF
ncbi:MAG: hypothetical protein V4702_06030 [Patescibacteria group bacterium]